MASAQPPRHSAPGFTLVELLAAVAVILVLLGLLMPTLGVIRERSRRTQAAGKVAEIHQALQSYASEERRHRYPPQTAVADLSLRWAPFDAPPASRGNLNLLWTQGIEVDLSGLDRSGSPPFTLRDPWTRPYQYQVDDDLLGSSGAHRPLGVDGKTPPLAAWNAAGARPWGYVWSTGTNGSADGTGWIYRQDDR